MCTVMVGQSVMSTIVTCLFEDSPPYSMGVITRRGLYWFKDSDSSPELVELLSKL